MKAKEIKKIESFYQDQWEKNQIYAYRDGQKREQSFVIDTPPPTISGSLHIGHVFSYAQTDIIARFQRMSGKNIFYPMGWDNNGLPTERRVQNLYKILCDPSLSHKNKHLEDLLERKNKKTKDMQAVSRKHFIDICRIQSKKDQCEYEKLWRHLALSVDWKQSYETISTKAQIISQLSFLDLYKKNLVENRYIPVFWDTDFQTAVAQADIEDRKKQGFYHNIRFQIEGEKTKSFVVSTTRPELLPACVAVAAHPEDDRYKKFFHKKAVTPLFFSRVPIFPSVHVDPEKGTGIVMICTFGDMEDVHFWKKNSLPLKQIFTKKGFVKETSEKNSIQHILLDSLRWKEAKRYYKELEGLSVYQARKKIVEILLEKKELDAKPLPIEHFVKFYEKGSKPLELLPTRQWYIKILDHKEALLKQGQKVNWHPASMLKRYEQWVEGLNQDWCISRQRFFGVPFPIWYPLDEKKNPDYENPILPMETFFGSGDKKESLDPMHSSPSDWSLAYKEEQRGKAGGFIAEKSVMDTWATSSLTPQLSSHWLLDQKRHQELFPADLRPQAHEIIRTWAFYTIVKSFFHNPENSENIPWKHIAISGWVMSPERVKMSKSKGKNISPNELLDEYSADAIRYWAGKARLGQDTIYDENLCKNGKRLAIKLFNASKFVMIQVKETNFIDSLSGIKVPVDLAWLCYLQETYQKITSDLKSFDHSIALNQIEKAFWIFCDNYLELVKGRAYQLQEENQKSPNLHYHVAEKSQSLSAVKSLDVSLYLFLKMLAPYMPYITEEVWSARYAKSGSIHLSDWSSNILQEIQVQKDDDSMETKGVLKFCFHLLETIRNEKATQKQSLSTPIKKLKVSGSLEEKKLFDLCKEDIARATQSQIGDMEWIHSDDPLKIFVKMRGPS